MRLTRLVTRDDAGDWLIYRPAEKWATEKDGSELTYENGRDALDTEQGWRSKLVSGLRCHWCVGFWIGAGVLASRKLAGQSKVGKQAWDAAMTALTLNQVVGMISDRTGN